MSDDNNFKRLEDDQEIDPLELSGIENRVQGELSAIQSIGSFFSNFVGRLIDVITSLLGGRVDDDNSGPH